MSEIEDLVTVHYFIFERAERVAVVAMNKAIGQFFEMIEGPASAEELSMASRIGDAVYSATLRGFVDALESEMRNAAPKDGDK
jgi:hypothetical protein